MKKKNRAQNVNKDNKHLFKAMLPVALFVFYVILDYINISAFLGISTDRINMGFFDVLLNSVIVVVLYIITYYFVDRRQIQKDKNSKDTADVLLIYAYKECLDNLQMVWNSGWVKQYIIPKVDGDKPVTENKIIMNLQSLPFASKGEILELSKGGYVEKGVLARYLHIQKEYNHIINMKITFYDLNNPQTDEQKALFMDINHRSDELMSMLGEEIRRLEVIS